MGHSFASGSLLLLFHRYGEGTQHKGGKPRMANLSKIRKKGCIAGWLLIS